MSPFTSSSVVSKSHIFSPLAALLCVIADPPALAGFTNTTAVSTSALYHDFCYIAAVLSLLAFFTNNSFISSSFLFGFCFLAAVSSALTVFTSSCVPNVSLLDFCSLKL